MLRKKIGTLRLSIGCLVALLIGLFSSYSFAQTKKPFTVVDDIEMTLFLGAGNDNGPKVRFSPDGKLFAVYSERGNLKSNKVEASLRFYRTESVAKFLEGPEFSAPPLPSMVVTRRNDIGPVIQQWRWLGDSSGVVMLEQTAAGKQRLVLADVRSQALVPLTSASENVEMFDVRDRTHFVYVVAEPLKPKQLSERSTESKAPATVGTGRDLSDLLFPKESSPPVGRHLWAVVGKRRFRVSRDGTPIVIEGEALGRGVALSPDGKTVVAKLLVSDVPSSWETLYPPPVASSSWRVRAGRNTAKQYVLIDLETGSTRSLTDAPISLDAGWPAYGSSEWSENGQEVVLPGTFIRSNDGKPSQPCVAIVNIISNTRTCIEMLRTRANTDVSEVRRTVTRVWFPPAEKNRLFVSAWKDNWNTWTIEYQREANGWKALGQSEGVPEPGGNQIKITVKQDINTPPIVIASTQNTSRTIWDPNPQLKNIELGDAIVYEWKGKDGRARTGGLYKPVNYQPGTRYPLVLQTHGFIEEGFRPSGTGFGPAYAARALAAHGIAVLQIGEPCQPNVPTEGQCAVDEYEAATNRLVADGLVDPGKIGIIGFSRTCYYVMEALTNGSSLRLKAASITDGVMESYFQFMQDPGRHEGESNRIIGAPPFGEGLQEWFKRSPGFKLDKVETPLLVNSEAGKAGLLFMWDAYAGLYYLRKPVDLILLNTDEHVLTNPALRLVSQGMSVDWFRFWLKAEEDSDPAKTEQFKRWRELRKMQSENGKP
jgi:dipeptidyl aminopeptidase/acylaminoacyl peptidase